MNRPDPCNIPDAWVDDFFALASGEGHKPHCGLCGAQKEYDYEVKAWVCINKECEGGG